MKADVPVGVAKSFQKADLFPFGVYKSGQDQMKKEGRYTEEYHRDERAEHLKLAKLVCYEAVRYLVGTSISAGAAVTLQQPVELLDHVALICIRAQCQ